MLATSEKPEASFLAVPGSARSRVPRGPGDNKDSRNARYLRRLTVDVVRADVMVQDVIAREKFKQDSVAVGDRIRPQALEPALQSVGLQTRIKRVGSEEEVLLVRQPLNGRRKLANGSLEVRGDRNTNDSPGRGAQENSSCKERTDRVLPRRWASRPASTSSSTSWTVNRRLRWMTPPWLSSNAFQGMRRMSSFAVTDTVGWLFMNTASVARMATYSKHESW